MQKKPLRGRREPGRRERLGGERVARDQSEGEKRPPLTLFWRARIPQKRQSEGEKKMEPTDPTSEKDRLAEARQVVKSQAFYMKRARTN